MKSRLVFRRRRQKRRTPATAGKLAGPEREETEESCRYSGFKRGSEARSEKRITDRWALSFGLVKCKPDLDLDLEVGTSYCLLIFIWVNGKMGDYTFKKSSYYFSPDSDHSIF